MKVSDAERKILPYTVEAVRGKGGKVLVVKDKQKQTVCPVKIVRIGKTSVFTVPWIRSITDLKSLERENVKIASRKVDNVRAEI